MELRKAVRYALQVPTVFIWKDLNGIEQRVEGRTRDISISGAYVFARVCPPEGTSVKVDMLLATVPNSPRSLRLNAQGRVVRAERPAIRAAERPGAAAGRAEPRRGGGALGATPRP